jgi:hypothetical protein
MRDQRVTMLSPEGATQGHGANVAARTTSRFRIHAQAHHVKKSAALERPDGGVQPRPPPPEMGLPKAPAPPFGV